MPPLSSSQKASVLIPVLPSSQYKPRAYDPPRRAYADHPLPIHIDTTAPRNARIVNRILDEGVPTFDIRIGDTDIHDVGLDEILDYVSAYELEEYENAQFKVEEEMLRLADEEDERIERERYERAKWRAKNKGVVQQQTESESDGEGGTDLAGGGEVEVGKHGRARPSYKQLFKPVRQRKQRRKRDPVTGELLDRSDEDEGMGVELASSSDEHVAGPSVIVAQGAAGEKKKRRRRRRDPVTGELLPLPPLPAGGVEASEESSSEAENMEMLTSKPTALASISLEEKAKRPRRRRHPITRELMPLGWRYNPDEDEKVTSTPRAEITVPTGLHRLSISQEHRPKRQRLDDPSAGRTSSRSPEITLQTSQESVGRTQSTVRGSPPSKASARVDKGKGRARDVAPLAAFSGGVIDLASSDNEEEASHDEEEATQIPVKPKPKILRRSMGGTTITQPSRRSTRSATSSTPDEPLSRAPLRQPAIQKLPSPRKPNSRSLSTANSSTSEIIPLALASSPSSSPEPGLQLSQPLTSIAHPNPPSSSEDESHDGEFPIEAILSHHLSDPRTHPRELGGKAVMLYQVKWEGFADPTWEPVGSFADVDEPGGGVVGEYRRRVGLD